MKLKFLLLSVVLLASCESGPSEYAEFDFGEKVLIFKPEYPKLDRSKLYVGFYTSSYDMQMLEPSSKKPYSGRIEFNSENSVYGFYDIEDGYVHTVNLRYKDSSPAVYLELNKGAVVLSKRWNREGFLTLEVIGGENWEMTEFDNDGELTSEIRNFVRTDYSRMAVLRR